MADQDQRPRFYQGQYLGADDLTAIVDAQRTGDARHALGAHTWGIATGLALTERPAPGAPNRVDVLLQPGFGWDGFGRALAAARPVRLPETLFAEIPFSPALDDPVSGTGRLVQVWITYDEIAHAAPLPGFETCAAGDTSSRIGETFRFVIGQQAPAMQRAPVRIGPASVDALDALRHFDPEAKELWDTSVPHQAFPGAGRPPRWLVPVGLVRWIARDNALGYFAARTLVAADAADIRIRAFRRHAGVIAERIESAAGVIVLHRREEDPAAAHRYARLAGDVASALALEPDLVWVEGNLRVGGDAKINGGRLHFRDADGRDRNTPLYLSRYGDEHGADGRRELRIALGDTSQKDNKLCIGPQRTVGTVIDVAPRLVVQSGVDGNDAEGRVGVNTASPAAALEARGDWTGEDGAARLSGAQPTLRFDATGTGSGAWIAQLTSSPPGALRLAHRTGPATWQGVLYATAEHRIGIGTDAPTAALHVQGERVRIQNATGAPGSRILELRTDGTAVDVQSVTSHLYLRSSHPGGAPDRHIVMNPFAGGPEPDGLVGIGLVPGAEKLEVRGNILFGAVPNLFALGAGVALRVVAGRVEATGAATGPAFTAVLNGAGSANYTVSFVPPYAAPPVVVASLIDSANDDNVLTLGSITAAGFTVRVRDLVAPGAPLAQDTAFSFVAFGVP